MQLDFGYAFKRINNYNVKVVDFSVRKKKSEHKKKEEEDAFSMMYRHQHSECLICLTNLLTGRMIF